MDRQCIRRVVAICCILIGAAISEIPIIIQSEPPLSLLILVGPILFGAGVGGLYGRFRLGTSLGLVATIGFVFVTFYIAAGQFRRGASIASTSGNGSVLVCTRP